LLEESARATIASIIGGLHIVRSDLSAVEFAMSVLGCSMIALIGLLMIVFPTSSYEWFVVKFGRDSHRRYAPETGRSWLWWHRFWGLVMLLGGSVFVFLLIRAKMVAL